MHAAAPSWLVVVRRVTPHELAGPGERTHTIRRLLFGILVFALGATSYALRRVEVRGPSMLPTLADGERLLVRPKRRYSVGDLVILRDPEDATRLLVKRIVSLEGDRARLEGDNPGASRDSRDFGTVGTELLLGVAFYRYHPAGQAGFVR